MLRPYCRSVLELLLSPDFPGVHELRRQLPLIEGDHVDEFGDFLVYLPPGTERASVVDDNPVQAFWASRRGGISFVLFVDEGLLSGVEVWRSGYEDAELPPLGQFKLYVRRFKGEEFHIRVSLEELGP